MFQHPKRIGVDQKDHEAKDDKRNPKRFGTHVTQSRNDQKDHDAENDQNKTSWNMFWTHVEMINQYQKDPGKQTRF